MNDNEKLPYQRLDAYAVAKALAKLVHDAQIADAELRDQATRAAKSVFTNTCEGLPQRSAGLRRKYFTIASGSLFEALGAVDLAAELHSMRPDLAAEAQRLGVRMHRMLRALLR